MTTLSLERARRLLQDRFGHADFRAGQGRAVESVLAGRDTLVVLPTGGGKSLCYQVPALLLPGLTVVVSPLISLMKDQVDGLTGRGIGAAFVNSTLTSTQLSERLAQASQGKARLLYLAPERLESERTCERLREIGVSLVAVDEAHCISEWGHDFRPSYRRLREACARLGRPPIVALTATATPAVRRDIVGQLALRSPQVVVTGFDRRNLLYSVVRVRSEREKDERLLAALRASAGQAIVYAPTRKAAERIATLLARARVDAAPYHAGLGQRQRRRAQEAFVGETVRVITATNAFGMGIDKHNVRLVVHHAMPGSVEAYYQEAGRAGRDGETAECLLLYSSGDRVTHEFLLRGAYPERRIVRRLYQVLQGAADRDGRIHVGLAELAGAAGGVSERVAEGALRILAVGAVIERQAGAISPVRVRLLATADRIRRELGAGRDAERELLRALWRAGGERLYDGLTADLDGLAPPFGGIRVVCRLLERLRRRQFVDWERTGGDLRLASSCRPLDSFPIDWPGLDRRRRAEVAKLDAMEHYVHATGCRRALLLRYFGDPAAGDSCARCDNCLVSSPG